MGMKNCLQGNRGFTSCGASGLINTHNQFSFKENVYFPIYKSVMKSSVEAFSPSSCSSIPRTFHLKSSTSPFLCKASADYVDVVTACNWNDRVVASDEPVLVEFWAPGCSPSQMIEPIVVDELAKEYGDKIICYKLNTEDCPTIALQYEIKSIPTVVVFKDGEKKVCFDGEVSKSALVAAIEKCLG